MGGWGGFVDLNGVAVIGVKELLSSNTSPVTFPSFISDIVCPLFDLNVSTGCEVESVCF